MAVVVLTPELLADLDAQAVRAHIGHHEILDGLVARDAGSLHGGAQGDDLVGVERAVRQPAEHIGHEPDGHQGFIGRDDLRPGDTRIGPISVTHE